jgi:hypothetical protein
MSFLEIVTNHRLTNDAFLDRFGREPIYVRSAVTERDDDDEPFMVCVYLVWDGTLYCFKEKEDATIEDLLDAVEVISNIRRAVAIGDYPVEFSEEDKYNKRYVLGTSGEDVPNTNYVRIYCNLNFPSVKETRERMIRSVRRAYPDRPDHVARFIAREEKESSFGLFRGFPYWSDKEELKDNRCGIWVDLEEARQIFAQENWLPEWKEKHHESFPTSYKEGVISCLMADTILPLEVILCDLLPFVGYIQ